MVTPKLIEYAFLCASAGPNERGGVDILHLDDKFFHSDLSTLMLVLCISTRQLEHLGGQQPYHIFGEFRLGIRLMDESGADVYVDEADMLIANRIHLAHLPLSPIQPGKYTLQVEVDGDPQSTLNMFLLD